MARTELLSPTVCERKEKVRHGHLVKEALWKPAWFGEHYAIRREASLGGTHASPRLHFRRGHFTNQPYGPKSTLRKKLWIDPILVGQEAK